MKIFSTKTQSYHFICKVKGFSLNFANSQKINFDSMKRMILIDQSEKIILNNPHKIRKNKTFELYTTEQSTTYQVNYDKITSSFKTEPFGF
jgi:hypothetical protein